MDANQTTRHAYHEHVQETRTRLKCSVKPLLRNTIPGYGLSLFHDTTRGWTLWAIVGPKSGYLCGSSNAPSLTWCSNRLRIHRLRFTLVSLDKLRADLSWIIIIFEGKQLFDKNEMYIDCQRGCTDGLFSRSRRKFWLSEYALTQLSYLNTRIITSKIYIVLLWS